MTYEQAIKRLEEIVTGLESGTLELEKFTEYMAEAENSTSSVRACSISCKKKSIQTKP